MTSSTPPFRVVNYNDLPKTWIVENQLARAGFRSNGSLLSFNFPASTLEKQPPHHHPFDQITFVLEGEMLFELNGESQRMGRGDMAYIPANAPHTASSVGDVPLVVVDIFAPAREDYLFLTEHQSEFAPAAR